MIKAFIFDMDGTLVDSEKYWTLAPRKMLEHFGYNLSDEEWDNAPWRAASYRVTCKNICEGKIFDLPINAEEAAEWIRGYMYSVIYPSDQYVHFKPGAIDTLEAAKATRLPMCLLSATEPKSLEFTLNRLDLKKYFCFYQSTAIGQSINKSDPHLFEIAAERMGVKAEECLVLEDALYAMKSSKQVGCKVWAIYDPKHWRDVDEIKTLAERYFNNHQEMAQAMRELG